ncbi:MAG: hypothetical protein LBL67_00015 [Coriobacteriales bacterium]|jgi:Flp pilus assembly protein TadG|nr:hypothetical protein [Coriobacteriales bacterium]
MGLKAAMRGQHGQMAVELAVCIPVMISLALVAFELITYLGLCARFDRVVAEAVRVQAASPAASAYTASARRGAVQTAIVEAMEGAVAQARLRIDTQLVQAKDNPACAAVFGANETYRATLSYQPWLFGQTIFGSDFGRLEHSAQNTVQPYRPGVLF